MSHLNLIPLSREVLCDDTLKEMKIVLRFDAKIEDSDVKVQLLVDFRHKKNPRLSKPKAYLTLSHPRQFEDLVTASLAMACFHRLRKHAKLTSEDILACYDEIVKWIREDVATLTEVMFRNVKEKVKEKAK